MESMILLLIERQLVEWQTVSITPLLHYMNVFVPDYLLPRIYKKNKRSISHGETKLCEPKTKEKSNQQVPAPSVPPHSLS